MKFLILLGLIVNTLTYKQLFDVIGVENENKLKNSKSSSLFNMISPSKDKSEKVEEKQPDSINFIQKKSIRSSLKHKETMLSKVNSLLKKVEKRKLILSKNKHMADNISSFIQKHENQVKDLNSSYEVYIKTAENNFDRKKEEFEKVKNRVENEFTKLEEHLNSLKTRINDIKTKFSFETILKQIKQKVEVKNIKLEEKLSVAGSSTTNTLNTNGINVGSISVDENGFKIFNENTKFIAGRDILHLSELKSNLIFIQKMTSKCGEDLNRCKILSNSEMNKKFIRQEELISRIEALKAKTHKKSKYLL
jgi:hypothetical protein